MGIRISSTLSITVVVLAFLWLVGAGPATSPCSSNCTLPDCQCASKEIPGGLQRDQVPQMVTITLGGAIRVKDYEMFYSKILQGRKNPNRCNVSVTFFASHKNTDYSLATELANDGHELAVHTITRREPRSFWSEDRNNTEELTDEILGMRDILSRWAHVNKSNVVGYRSPFLASSENQLKILHENDFLYDSSMMTNEMYWPFTLDYKSPFCNSSAVCPEESLPGLWVVPIINKVQNSSTTSSCNLIDSCVTPSKTTKEQWMNFFMDNFERHYNNSKAPFGLYASSLWFFKSNSTQRLQAFMDFLDYLSSLKDVYIVTMSQLIAWSRNPTPLNNLSTFEPWQCPNNPPTNCTYTDPNICNYTIDGEEFILRLCKDDVCPEMYPNITNPYGVNTILTSSSVVLEVLSTSIAPTSHLSESSHVMTSAIPGSPGPTSSRNTNFSHTSIDLTNSVITILPTTGTTLTTSVNILPTSSRAQLTAIFHASQALVSSESPSTTASLTIEVLSTSIASTSHLSESSHVMMSSIPGSPSSPSNTYFSHTSIDLSVITILPTSGTTMTTSVNILPTSSGAQLTAIHTSQALVSSESPSITASLTINTLSTSIAPTSHLSESSHAMMSAIPESPSSRNMYFSHTSIDRSVITTLPTSVTTLTTSVNILPTSSGAQSAAIHGSQTLVSSELPSTTASLTIDTLSKSIAPTSHLSESSHVMTSATLGSPSSRNTYITHTSIDLSVITILPTSVTVLTTSVNSPPTSSRAQSTAIHTSQTLVSSELPSTTASLTIEVLSKSIAPTSHLSESSHVMTSATPGSPSSRNTYITHTSIDLSVITILPTSATVLTTSVNSLPTSSRAQSTAIHTSQTLVSSETPSTATSPTIEPLSADPAGFIAGLSIAAVLTAGVFFSALALVVSMYVCEYVHLLHIN